MAAVENTVPACGLRLGKYFPYTDYEKHLAEGGGGGAHGADCLLYALAAMDSDVCRAAAGAAWANACTGCPLSTETITRAMTSETYAPLADYHRQALFDALCSRVEPGAYTFPDALLAIASFDTGPARHAALVLYLDWHGPAGWTPAARDALLALFKTERLRASALTWVSGAVSRTAAEHKLPPPTTAPEPAPATPVIVAEAPVGAFAAPSPAPLHSSSAALGATGAASAQPPSGARGGECVVCLSGPASHIMHPCCHLCACGECGPRFESKECPVCREAVASCRRVYFV